MGENYPPRLWKFTEHNSDLPAGCARTGWVARAGFGTDSLDFAIANFWYSMTITSNVPPEVRNTTAITSTFSGGPFTVEATITDCDPSTNGANAGVSSASIIWS